MAWKTIVGICLIIGSLLTLVFWEVKGREYLLSPTLLASRDIPAGTLIGAEDLTKSRIPAENVLTGAVLPQDADMLVGLAATCDLLANQQLVASYFQPESSVMSKGQSVFVLPEFWIYSRSSALRSGDTVSLYVMPESISIGTFIVAFVKDSNENEVCDTGGQNFALLDRKNTMSGISHIEIICTLEEYLSINSKVTEAGFGNLLIVIQGAG